MIEPAAMSAALVTVRIDIGQVQSKREFLAQMAEALNFPEWFGHNWDALNDCLTDLSWLGGTGWVVIIENAKNFAEANTEDFATAVRVCKSATEYWRETPQPLWILFYDPADWNSGLPLFPGDHID